MALDQIQNFLFLSLSGSPVWPTERIKTIQRPGVDGTAFLLQGKASQPFTLVSQVDVETMEAGQVWLEHYQSLIGGSPVALVQGGINYALRNRYVEVLNVQQSKLHAIAGSTGGLNSPSGAFLEARWQLMGIELIPA